MKSSTKLLKSYLHTRESIVYSFCPMIVYPRDRAFFSTMEGKELGSCYLSYIDQDMEKME